MAVRTARLSGPTTGTGALTEFLLNPEDSGQTLLIKWLVACNPTGTSRTLTIAHQGPSGPAQIFRKAAMVASAHVSEPAFWVLEPGEAIHVGTGADNSLVVGLYGAVLAGVAF